MNILYVVVRDSVIIYIGSNIRVAKDKARAAKAPLIFKVSVSFVVFVPQFSVTSVFVHCSDIGFYTEYPLETYHKYFHFSRF